MEQSEMKKQTKKTFNVLATMETGVQKKKKKKKKNSLTRSSDC